MASKILWNTWITFNVTLCSRFKFLSRDKSLVEVGTTRPSGFPSHLYLTLRHSLLRPYDYIHSLFHISEVKFFLSISNMTTYYKKKKAVSEIKKTDMLKEKLDVQVD